ncbi:uncharacterized protein LOC107043475 isoform X2 [Diachasma alloeum]|uniref:uncharacterized protein LOC107043475 isoform X2 n=1 Tax=Diachasma alloeum TaxID=454923 RepID=UPI0007384C4C|nr:uncharacterized protein LOC107043475 isoform X2 [Diachasma alloeum]
MPPKETPSPEVQLNRENNASDKMNNVNSPMDRLSKVPLPTSSKAKFIEKKQPRDSDKKSNDNCTQHINMTNLLKRSIERSQQKVVQLIEDLTKKVNVLVDNWEQLKNTPQLTPSEGMERYGMDPKSGFVRLDENGVRNIHIGKGIWMKEADYDEVVWTANSTSVFVRNMGFNLFGEEMKNFTVTGITSAVTGGKKKHLIPQNALLSEKSLIST